MTTNNALTAWTILFGAKGQKFECQALSINSAIQQCEEAHPGEIIISASQDTLKQVEVSFWGSEHFQHKNSLIDYFLMEVIDKRLSSGRMYINVASEYGNINNIMPLAIEISHLPGTTDGTQCVHLHFDNNNLAMSIFKQGGTYILRPETGVTIRDTVLPNSQRAYILE